MTKKTERPFYLKRAVLSGYKSIDSVDIEFVPGLNIIIGKNAAGKTNFLNFLYSSLKISFSGFANFTSELLFQNGKEVVLKSSAQLQEGDLNFLDIFTDKVKSTVRVNGKVVRDKKSEMNTPFSKMAAHNLIVNTIFISHGVPPNYHIVDLPLSFTVSNGNNFSQDLVKLIQSNKLPNLLQNLIFDLLLAKPIKPKNSQLEIKKEIRKAFSRIDNLKLQIKKYSPIEDIRLSDNINFFFSEDKENLTISNIFLEFNISGSWLPFSSLSDGTKRIFYILSEIYDYREFLETRKENGINLVNPITKIILIEEPELGIHPHQFHEIMSYIKEQAESKQIIISTHSPQSLNVLDDGELDNIIVASHKDKSTHLKKLDTKQKDKAVVYMNGDYLSDYWLYSDLED